MREINASVITETIEKLCIKANKQLPNDIADCLHKCASNETNPLGASVLCDLEKGIALVKSDFIEDLTDKVLKQ